MPREARPYVAVGKLPSDLEQPRDWWTRLDPFEEHWPEIGARLQAIPVELVPIEPVVTRRDLRRARG